MRVFSFHLMPYPGLPDDYDGPAWVTCPNGLYDPGSGPGLYNRYLDELVHAEELGFDGVCVNEHHQNAYGLMPSPNLLAAALARETSRVRIAVVGNALPLYDPPTRVAEELAMIDNLSGGRLIAGFVVGGGPEYYSFSINPAFARERFAEAHDVVLKAWTEPGPTEHIGKHYRLRFLNSWPRPVQRPHPEIWIPGAGSLETMEFVARHRYAYMGIPYFHRRVFDRTFALFRDACRREGYTYDPAQAGWLTPIYVADTDERARAEFEPHFWYFVRRLLPGITISPPGYTSVRSLESMLRGIGTFAVNLRTWDEVVEGRYAIVGSPETVYRQLEECIATFGTGNLLGLFQLGTLGPAETRRNLGLFAAEVLPRLRERFPEGRAILDAALAGSGEGARAAGSGESARAAGSGDTAPAAGSGGDTARVAVDRGDRGAPARGGPDGDGSPVVRTERVPTAVGTVEVRRGGDGPPVVYLHSALGEGDGLPFLDHLAERAEVVAPMFPGFGGSGGIEKIDDVEDAAFHLVDLWDRLGLGAPAVVGLSLGGWLALELATRWPERVGPLVLVNPVGLHLPGAPIADIFGRSPGELARDLFADQGHPLAQALQQVDHVRSDLTTSADVPLEVFRPLAATMAATARLGWDPYLHNPRLRGRLGRVTSPTLVVRGEADGLVPAAHAETYAAELPAARLVVLAGAGHLAPLERPEGMAALVHALMTDLPIATAVGDRTDGGDP